MVLGHGKIIIIAIHKQNIAKMIDVVIRVKKGRVREVIGQDNPMSAEEVER